MISSSTYYSAECDSCMAKCPKGSQTLAEQIAVLEAAYWHVDHGSRNCFCGMCMKAYRCVSLALDARLEAELAAQADAGEAVAPSPPSIEKTVTDEAIILRGKGGEA